MSLWINVALIFLGVVFIFHGILLSRLRRELRKDRPCYRCAEKASGEYMGLHYCTICCDVVMMTMGAVKHDPPFGYPGSPGYLEFPKKERASS